MVTPITAPERMELIASRTTGFVYTVSVLGVTGSRDQLSDTVEDLIVKLKKLTKVPICVGFGISKPEHAAAIVQAGADGVIIGSKIVSMIESNLEDKNNMKLEIAAFLKQVRESISSIKP